MIYDDEYIAKAIKGQYAGYGNQQELKLNFGQKILFYILKSGMAFVYITAFVVCRIPVFSSLFETFARIYSRGAVGFYLRGLYYKNKLKSMGKNVFIDLGVTIWEPENVEIDDNSHIENYVTIFGGGKGHGFVKIGKYVHVSCNCVLAGRGGLTLGDYSGYSAGCKIFTATNYYEHPDKNSNTILSMSGITSLDMQYVIEKPVTIDEYAFIGLNGIVLPGVIIGKAAVIGANSLVNKDIPPFSIAVGSPARVIKQRPQPGKG
jgi:acetyltransferase-like isoleucine patch superfamily enzyme